MSNRVHVQLSVQDNGTRVLQGFSDLVDRTGSRLSSMGAKGSSAFSGMTSSIAGGVLQANLLTSAFNSALGVAQSLGGAVTKAFNEASQIQLDNVGLAADISTITGKAFDATQEELRGISQEVERMGNAFPVADSLIAEAQRGFLDDIYQANEEMGKGIDAITKDAANMLPRIAVMAEKSNFSASEAARFSSQFINGQLTEAQLRNLDFFNRNKLFMGTVEDYLKKSGSELKDLSKQELYNLYQAGLNAQVTDDYVREAGQTVKGVWNSFTGKLFGENFGMLSLVRDLDDAKGDQSVIAAAGLTLNSLLGEDGLISAITTVLGPALGLNDKSLLLALRSGLLTAREWIEDLATGVASLSDFQVPDLSNLSIWLGDQLESLLDRGTDLLQSIDFKSLAGQAFGLINNLLSSAANGLRNFDTSKLGGFFNEIINSVGEWVSGIDYGELGGQLGQLTAQAFNSLGNLILSIDWSQVPPILLRAAIGAVELAAGFVGSAVTSYDWSLPIRGFFATFGILWDSLIGMVQAGWDSLDNSVQEAFKSAASYVADRAVDLLLGPVTLFNKVNELFNSLISSIPGVSFRLPTLPEASAPTPSTTTSNPAPAPSGIDSMADGNFPGFLGGLLQAATREKTRMPAGSNIVVANDSEAILNQAQQQSLVSRLGSPMNISFSIEGISINAGDQNPEQLAEQVMGHIERKFNQFAQSKLSSLAV